MKMFQKRYVCLYCDSCGYRAFRLQVIEHIRSKGFQCPKCQGLLYVERVNN